MIASAKLTEQSLGLSCDYSALLCLDTKYIAGKMMVVRSFVTGMRLFVIDPCANPLSLLPVKETIDFSAMVPYQIKAILESKRPHLLDKLKICLIGGAPLDNETFERLQKFTVKVFLSYGMTETISHIALQPVNNGSGLKYFKTLPGVNIFKDSRGCLLIDAPFLNERVVTNDVVEIINTNTFIWAGRVDNIINSGGIKLSPEVVEEKIGKIFTRLNIPNSFFLYGKPDHSFGEKVVLIMESPLPDASTLNLLAQALHHSIPVYEIPKQLYESAGFFYTETRKVMRDQSFSNSCLVKEFFPE